MWKKFNTIVINFVICLLLYYSLNKIILFKMYYNNNKVCFAQDCFIFGVLSIFILKNTRMYVCVVTSFTSSLFNLDWWGPNALMSCSVWYEVQSAISLYCFETIKYNPVQWNLFKCLKKEKIKNLFHFRLESGL